MQVRLLGTGSADGWPNPFCACGSCTDRPRPIPLQETALIPRRTVLACFAAATLAGGAFAQTPEWPQAKPITYVVPFTAGGSTDVVGRTLAEKLQAALKQTVVV